MDRMFTDPKTGSSIRFFRTAHETAGDLLEVQVSYTPLAGKPPAHYHPHQEERFEVLEGQITVEMNGTQRIFDAGEEFVVPKGVHHAMWNGHNTNVVMRWQIRPALRTQEMFESLWGLQQDGKLSSTKPELVRISVILNHFRDEFRLSSPPVWIQSILFPLLAAIGRLAGYLPHYEKYSV